MSEEENKPFLDVIVVIGLIIVAVFLVQHYIDVCKYKQEYNKDIKYYADTTYNSSNDVRFSV